MGQNKSEVPHGSPKRTMTWFYNTQITATADPLIKFTIPVGCTPLSLRMSGSFDFTTTDEDYTLSLEDDTTKISTDGTAIAATGYVCQEATFAAGTHIAKDSVLEIIITIGTSTTPTIDALVIQFDYLED